MFSLKIITRILLGGCFILFQNNTILPQNVSDSKNNQFFISIEMKSPREILGAKKVETALQKIKIKSQLVDKTSSAGKEQVQVKILNKNEDSKIGKEGYRISKIGSSFIISAIDESGAMYGLMDFAEQIEMQKGLKKITEKVVNPRFAFRAVKYNLPGTPTERTNPFR